MKYHKIDTQLKVELKHQNYKEYWNLESHS